MDKFRSFSVTHKGAKHVGDENCQDASTHVPLDNAVIAVVADGHGSARCFRSDIGSKAAVNATENTIKLWLQNLSDAVSDSDDFKVELHAMVKQIINKWFIAVMKDEETNPLQSDSRLETVTDKYKERYINNPDYRTHAYGTTLMAAVISDNYWFAFQVGDGKCVVLCEDGTWKLPIPWDDRCSFNTTTSICDDDSLSGFRYWFGLKEIDESFTEYGFGVDGQGHDTAPVKNSSRPLAIFVASDGVEDSYPTVNNDKYVINFYRNRIIELAENGISSFAEEINNFAKRFADRESKDDVSIAGIFGDFSNKTDMVARMKRESEVHEATEMAAVKRRDADEKRDALNAVKSRTSAVTANQTRLEHEIESLEQEIRDLETKIRYYESILAKGESEVSASSREMSEAKGKVNELENDRKFLFKDERLYSSDVSRADNDVRLAQREWEKSRDDIVSRQGTLAKADEKLKKQLKKQAANNPVPPPVLAKPQNAAVIGQQGHYPQQGQHPPQRQPQQPQVQPAHEGAGLFDGIAQFFSPDLESLERSVDNAKRELNTATQHETTARQRYDRRRDELSPLQQKLASVQEKIRQVEYELKQAEQGYNNAEMQNRNQRAAVSQYRNDITDIEKQIKNKQTEISKLKAELDTLREQTKRQTDMLAEIEEAYEKAEAEAQKYEAIIQ
jgi:predicted  nucleic acid-binding Zn-ribbon protein